MKVFITGSTGFVGLNIVQALLEEGHKVHSYVRKSANLTFLKQFDVTLHEGELTDYSVMEKEMKGMDAVIHCAGNTSSYDRDYPLLHKTNVTSTENIVRAALENKLKRLVYTSTTSTIGAKDDPNSSSDESTPLEGFRAKNPYGISKIKAEEVVRGAQENGLDSIILNPAEVLGPFDHNLQWGRMVLAVCGNQLPFVPPGSGSFCFSREVGKAHVSALSKGEPGSRYILGGENVSYSQFINRISKVVGITPDIPDVSYEALMDDAILQDKAFPETQKLPPIDPYRMRVFKGHYFFSSQQAEQDLGFQSAPLEKMIQECFNWYKGNGFLG